MKIKRIEEHFLPEQVEHRVQRAVRLLLVGAVVGRQIVRAARVDEQHHDNAGLKWEQWLFPTQSLDQLINKTHHNGHQRGDQVVAQGQAAHLARVANVQLGQRADQGGGDQRQDDALEHAHQHLDGFLNN
jgi:hypothetical protein